MKENKNIEKITKLGLIVYLGLLFGLPLTVAQALTINVDLEVSSEVYPGDSNFFSYTISSDENISLTYAPYVSCPNAPIPPIEYFTVDIGPNKHIKKSYNQFYVKSSYLPQTCQAIVEVISPISLVKKQNFEIKTKPSFDIQIFSCKDSGCTEKSKVFVKGEKVYLDYSSEISKPEVKGKLTFPDKTTKVLTLPTNILLEQVGKYLIETEAKKEGYKTNIQTLELVVLKEEPKVIDKRICNANGKCEPELGENLRNCPQDCPLPIFKPARSPSFWFVVILGVITGVLIGSIIYFWLEQRRARRHTWH